MRGQWLALVVTAAGSVTFAPTGTDMLMGGDRGNELTVDNVMCRCQGMQRCLYYLFGVEWVAYDSI